MNQFEMPWKSAKTCFLPARRSRKAVAAVLSAIAFCMVVHPVASGQVEWPQFGQNNSNTAGNHLETAITASTVSQLKMKWKFTTKGDVSARPAVVDGVVYFLIGAAIFGP